VWTCLSLLLVLASTLSKETGITGIVPLIAYQLAENNRDRREGVWARGVARGGLMVGLGVGYVLFRRWLTVDVVLLNVRHVENGLVALRGLPFVLSNAIVHLTYARLLLLPSPLSVDYSYNCLEIDGSAHDWRNGVSVLLYASIALGLYRALVISPRSSFSVSRAMFHQV